MLFLRIRQAEVALADQRLDEALDLVNRPDVRAHRRGQDLVGKLARALVSRGRQWMDKGRPADAAIDADKALRLAGSLPDAVELKAQATAAMLDTQDRHRRSADALARARFAMNHGRLASAHRLVDRGEFSTASLQVIMDDLREQQLRVDGTIASAEAAMARGDHDAAVNDLLAARKLDATNPKVRQLVAAVHRELSQRANEAIEQGRVDLAVLLEQRLVKLSHDSLDVEQYRQALAHLRAAWEAVERGQVRRAEETMRRLSTTLPRATWIAEAADRLQQAATAIEAVRAGPMGLLASAGPAASAHFFAGSSMNETLPPPAVRVAGSSFAPPARRHPTAAAAGAAALGTRWMIQVDGAGSFVVVREASVSIGPISSSARAAVGLICEPTTPTVKVERVEDDYFLRSPSPVTVNDAPATSKLLSNGDRLALSPRCRTIFALPCPASTTATIDLTGARHPRGDVRRIILMDRDLVIAPGGASHVRCDSLNEPVVIVHRDGQLFLKGGTAVTMGDQPIDDETPLQPGLPVRGAGFGFVITAA